MIGPFAIDMYLPALPEIGRELGVDVGQVQLTLSVFLLGLAVGQAFLGPVVDRWGRRRPLLIGLAIFVVASVGCPARIRWQRCWYGGSSWRWAARRA